MIKEYKALIYASIIGLLCVAIFLGFLSGIDNAISWLLIVAIIATVVIYNYVKSNKVIKWNASYSVGIESIDLDHKKLLSLLNQFNTAHEYYMGDAFERQALKDLVDYTCYHFEREENMMADAGYEGLTAHKQQHQQMITQIQALEQKYCEQGHKAFSQVSAFLSDWLINHINGSDKQYTDCLTKHGCK